MKVRGNYLVAAVLGLGILIASSVAGAAGEVQQIKEKGVLVVGVKADAPPFGFRTPSGEIVGIEPDLARDIARRMNVKVEFVPVIGANLIQFLQQGRVDMLIATMSDTPARRKLIDIVLPDYYASGYNVMVPKSMKVKSWAQMKGKEVCASLGAYFNTAASQTMGLEIKAFNGVAAALTAMRQGRCVAFLYDDTSILGQLMNPEWADYEMPLATQSALPWGIGVRTGATDLAKVAHDAVIAWNQQGTILQLETKYGMTKHSAFAQEAADAARKNTANGAAGGGSPQ